MENLELFTKLKLNRRQPCICHIRASLVALFIGASQSAADNNYANTCDSAAEVAAARSNVPLSVLKAVSRTETGRLKHKQIAPWPWTVNMEGKGVWFETPDAARAYAYKHYKRGARSFDVGCFQINYKWHHHAFASIEEMFEPVANARYAASFLSKLHSELGSWEDAVGAYHSRTAKHSEKYKKIYAQHYETVTASSDNPTQASSAANSSEHVNRFPLLKSDGGMRSMGSLTMLSNLSGASIFTPASPLYEPKP